MACRARTEKRCGLWIYSKGEMLIDETAVLIDLIDFFRNHVVVKNLFIAV